MYTQKGDNQPITAEQVYRQILRRIIKLKLEPGQLISENQMAKEYGVSRSVIRTVFVRLQQNGFLDVYPQRGTYVSRINLQHIEDLLILRTAVEKEVIYEMFTSLGHEERSQLVSQLEENMAEQEKCRDETDYSGRFPRIDSAFHKIMIDSVGRYALVNMLNDLMYHVQRWRNFDVAFGNRISELIREHWAIVNAIKAEDLILAQQSMANHLETITSIAGYAVAKYPSYFIA